MSAATPVPSSVLDIPVERIDGTPTSLAEHQGKVLLIVNVASQCGFTPQYAGLEALYEANREKGFVICGFPANDFAAQEPGSNAEIQSFCETSFGVKFPMYSRSWSPGMRGILCTTRWFRVLLRPRAIPPSYANI